MSEMPFRVPAPDLDRGQAAWKCNSVRSKGGVSCKGQRNAREKGLTGRPVSHGLSEDLGSVGFMPTMPSEGSRDRPGSTEGMYRGHIAQMRQCGQRARRSRSTFLYPLIFVVERALRARFLIWATCPRQATLAHSLPGPTLSAILARDGLTAACGSRCGRAGL